MKIKLLVVQKISQSGYGNTLQENNFTNLKTLMKTILFVYRF